MKYHPDRQQQTKTGAASGCGAGLAAWLKDGPAAGGNRARLAELRSQAAAAGITETGEYVHWLEMRLLFLSEIAAHAGKIYDPARSAWVPDPSIRRADSLPAPTMAHGCYREDEVEFDTGGPF